jgi:hypothetical protein
LLANPENVHFDAAEPTINQLKDPTCHPAASPTVLFTTHRASVLSALYSTGGALDQAESHVSVVEAVNVVEHTDETELSHEENVICDVRPLHSRNPRLPGGVLTGGLGGGGLGGVRAGGLGGVGGTGGGLGGWGGGGLGVGCRHATTMPVSSSSCVPGLKNVKRVSVLKKPSPRFLYSRSGAMTRVEMTLSYEHAVSGGGDATGSYMSLMAMMLYRFDHDATSGSDAG